MDSQDIKFNLTDWTHFGELVSPNLPRQRNSIVLQNCKARELTRHNHP